jgi:DNA topoisomerase-3
MARSDGCGFSFGKSPAGRTFEPAEASSSCATRHIGPLDGFRSKAGWPFVAEMALKYSDEDKNFKLEFDFGDDKKAETGEIVEFQRASHPGPAPSAARAVFEHGKQLRVRKVRAHRRAAHAQLRLQDRPGHPAAAGGAEQMTKLLATGKTDLLDKFVSMRTRRAFKAFLAWDAEAGKVNFEFAPSKFPPRNAAGRAGHAAEQPGIRPAGRDDGPIASGRPKFSTAARRTLATWNCFTCSPHPHSAPAGCCPCCRGTIRSAFAMTEPDVASSVTPPTSRPRIQPVRQRLCHQRPQVVHHRRTASALQGAGGHGRV